MTAWWSRGRRRGCVGEEMLVETGEDGILRRLFVAYSLPSFLCVAKLTQTSAGSEATNQLLVTVKDDSLLALTESESWLTIS
jgi:hypothetical protein